MDFGREAEWLGIYTGRETERDGTCTCEPSQSGLGNDPLPVDDGVEGDVEGDVEDAMDDARPCNIQPIDRGGFWEGARFGESQDLSAAEKAPRLPGSPRVGIEYAQFSADASLLSLASLALSSGVGSSKEACAGKSTKAEHDIPDNNPRLHSPPRNESLIPCKSTGVRPAARKTSISNCHEIGTPHASDHPSVSERKAERTLTGMDEARFSIGSTLLYRQPDFQSAASIHLARSATAFLVPNGREHPSPLGLDSFRLHSRY
ncbi:unnamed protein product [Darwinula stevensoni]|uniref:Uncharacterized protein n=1 Tax=Darwinula stevensoni TaxID=69355 RepID=A0A7R9ACG3_9CRUS|nr:unnamed protein product [Darwinula stevensoni]CAG0900346.1 unnamed protein product [Darwinula stevensoni]